MDTDGAAKRIEAAVDQLTFAIEQEDSDGNLTETVQELQDIVVEAGQLLETVDLETLPKAVDFRELPGLVDVEQIPTAIRERDPDTAIDLHTIRHAIRLRELWNSIDLVEFAEEAAQLKKEVVDVLDEDALPGDGTSEAVGEVRDFIAEVRPEVTNAAIQQQAQKRAREAREGVLKGHKAVEEVYPANRRQPGTRPRNPTAVSLHPSGPIPDSVSTRFSSVPSNVRLSKIDALPRVYGRRWRTIDRDR
ncbi:hypothetical protein EA472_16935 [Natrarchaeobius oligotrophus]|uniref:Uncharacterized protein n=2 Tax=Natrarchaeobius TaxID=2501796 RepID=A0A3N6MD41_NATCH|nr:hypothetical protein EA472_16935 [Natrarchaeobius chitinivorans]